MLSEASGICLVSWKIFTSYTGGSGVWGRLLYCTANEEGKFVEILTKPLWWPFKTETGNDAAFQRADISGRTRKAGSLCVIVWWEPSTNGYLINILESSHLSAGFGSICIFSTLYTCEIFFLFCFPLVILISFKIITSCSSLRTGSLQIIHKFFFSYTASNSYIQRLLRK